MIRQAQQNIITLDGPAGAGKGTIGQKIAVRLGWRFLDSGGLYRACAFLLQQEKYKRFDENEKLDVIQSLDYESIPMAGEDEAQIWINGVDVSNEVRSTEVAQHASKLAVKPKIRKILLEVQRNYFREPGLVADGRDMGSIVFPGAKLKVYLTANLQARTERKYKQLKQKGFCVNFARLYHEISCRDTRDSKRSHAPLTKPKGAIAIDTSSLSIDEVLSVVLDSVSSILDDETLMEDI